MKGICENCSAEFKAKLIHNGFNESAYAYCDKCGATGFIDGWRTDIPESAEFKAHGPIIPITVKNSNNIALFQEAINGTETGWHRSA